jgi:hypothetical protein
MQGINKRLGKVNVAKGIPKKILKNRRRMHPECDNNIMDQSARRQVLRMERTSYRMIEQKIEKRIVELSFGLWEVGDWTLWKVRPPPK